VFQSELSYVSRIQLLPNPSRTRTSLLAKGRRTLDHMAREKNATWKEYK